VPPTWPQFALTNTYRSADGFQRAGLRQLWLVRSAPHVHPQAFQDIRTFKALYDYTASFDPPPVLPDEEEILRPETLTLGGLDAIDNDPRFARKTYGEQRALRTVWLYKMSADDPEFQGLDPDEQMAFQQKVMRRGPALEQRGRFQFGRYDPVEVEEEIASWGRAKQSADRFAHNFQEMLTLAFGGLILGPMRLIGGEDTAVASWLRNRTRHDQWYSEITENVKNFWNTGLAGFMGYGAGLVLGPFFGVEKLFAGATGVAGAKLVTSAGAFQKLGQAIGMKLPALAYQTLGGAFAGGLQGIGEALQEGVDWYTYLPRDMTIGVGAEFVSRFFGIARAIRKVAKLHNVPVGKELNQIFATHPLLRGPLAAMNEVDPSGMLIKNFEGRSGAQLRSHLLGLDMVEETDRVVFRKAGQQVMEFTGDEAKRFQNANEWMDISEYADDLWEGTKVGKNVAEMLGMSPTRVEVRRGLRVPEAGRKYTLQTLKKHNLAQGLDFTLDPRGDISEVDKIYGMVYTQSPKKAADSLARIGIVFSDDAVENRAIITDFRHNLQKLHPDNAYFVVNKRNKSTVFADEMPKEFINAPDQKAPMIFETTFSGNANNIRGMLSNLRKLYANEGRAITRLAKSTHMDMRKFIDNEVVEIRYRVPDADGNLIDTAIHYPSIKEAQKAFTLGKNAGLKGVASSFFADDKSLQAKYKLWMKYVADRGMKRADFLPFQFVAAMADQNHYALGFYKGKYVLQDILVDDQYLTHNFDGLKDVVKFLNENDARQLVPDFTEGLSKEAAQQLTPELVNPLKEVYDSTSKTRHFTLTKAISRIGAPTQHAIEDLQRLTVVQDIAKRHPGLSPVRMYNTLRDSITRVNSMIDTEERFARSLGKGISKRQGEYIVDWMEGLLPDEKPLFEGMEYKTRDAVYREMVNEFGEAKAAQLTDVGTRLHEAYDRLFAGSGMHPSMYLKHYHPHLREEYIKRGFGLSDRVSMKQFTQMPGADKHYFFELMREIDARDVLWNKDPFEMYDTYSRLMARKMYLRPVIKDISTTFREISQEFVKAGGTPNDYRVVANYFGDLLANLQGIQAPSDTVFRLATDNTLMGIAKQIDAKIPGANLAGRMKGKFDLVSKVITLSTGAHIAGRGYAVARNLTQSLITGGSVIGDRWWLEGLDRAARPGALERMYDLGVVRRGMVPAGAGFEVQRGGILGWMVQKGMVPYKWADLVNRSIVYHGMEARVQEALDLYKRGKITPKRFARRSGAHLFGKAEYNEAINLFDVRNPAKAEPAFVHRLSRLAADRTQYLYDAFEHPHFARSGVGRIFGQYTSWPINFVYLVREQLMSDTLSVVDKAAFMARLAGTTAAVGSAFYAAGVDPKKWAPWNMALFQGGPYYQMFNDFLSVLGGDARAASSLANALSSLVPFAYEGEGILRAVQAIQDGDPYEAFLHFLSAPLRLDRYPRRDIFTDEIEDVISDALQGFVRAKKDTLKWTVQELGGLE